MAISLGSEMWARKGGEMSEVRKMQKSEMIGDYTGRKKEERGKKKDFERYCLVTEDRLRGEDEERRGKRRK